MHLHAIFYIKPLYQFFLHVTVQKLFDFMHEIALKHVILYGIVSNSLLFS